MRARRVILGVCLTLGCLLMWAVPAGAHAAVVSSSPAQGQRVDRPPSSVTIIFDQPVKPDGGGGMVLNSNGQNVDEGGSSHPAPNTLRAALSHSLPSGAYVANYTVTSVDGHIVSGGIVFLVGNAQPGAIGSLTRAPTSAATWYDRGGQFLTYVGVLAAGGLAFFLAFLFPGGTERRRLKHWCIVAIGVGVVGMVVTAGAQADLAGGGIGALGHWSIDSQAVGGKLEMQCGLQVVGLIACVASLRVRDQTARQATAFYGLLVSAGAFVAFGHALVSPERWLSTPADVVHAVFAAMWFGGLIGLVLVLHERVKTARHMGEMHAPEPVGVASQVTVSRAPLLHGTSTAVLERPPLSTRTDHGTHGDRNVLAGT